MSMRFDSHQLMVDFDAIRRRKRISEYRAATRCDIDPGTLAKLRNGTIEHITVNTMARMLAFMDTTKIDKYLINGD